MLSSFLHLILSFFCTNFLLIFFNQPKFWYGIYFLNILILLLVFLHFSFFFSSLFPLLISLSVQNFSPGACGWGDLRDPTTPRDWCVRGGTLRGWRNIKDIILWKTDCYREPFILTQYDLLSHYMTYLHHQVVTVASEDVRVEEWDTGR